MGVPSPQKPGQSKNQTGLDEESAQHSIHQSNPIRCCTLGESAHFLSMEWLQAFLQQNPTSNWSRQNTAPDHGDGD